MDFIDRDKESARLSRAIMKGGSFIIVYGRRRMGKSTLIRHVINNDDVYYEADMSEKKTQISLLVHVLRLLYPSFEGAAFDDWASILNSFNSVCREGSTLVLDEFPYLVKQAPELPSVIQRLVDSGSMRFNLIICGSSQRMMQKLVLDASEPLYGRASEKICLGPIRIDYWKRYFALSAVDAVKEFSVWGGVPRYWVLREDFDSLMDAVDYLVLDEHGLLANEPSALLMDEVPEFAPYSSIMTAVAGGNQRFSHIADSIGRKVNELAAPLSNLIEMNYLKKEVPFGESPAKSRKTLYKISDPFICFYYKFIVPNKSLLALGRTTRIKSYIEEKLPEVSSAVWEDCCRNAVSGNCLFDKCWGLAGRWWGSVPKFKEGKKTPESQVEIELDVVAESADRTTLLIGECKWAAPDYADRLYRVLKAKVADMQIAGIPFLSGKEIEYVLFLKSRPLVDFSAPNLHILYPEDVLDLQG